MTRRTERDGAAEVPLLVWEDHDGGFTARTLDGPGAVTGGATARKEVEQVKKHLEWVRKTDGWLEPPDFGDAELCFFPAAVRPGYEVGPNVRSYERPLAMRIPAVVGRREDGSFACVLPTLDSRFQLRQPEVGREGGRTPAAARRSGAARSVALPEWRSPTGSTP